MKKDDKEKIFTLLKKADAYINGYSSQNFLKTYEFFDDVSSEIESNKQIQNINTLQFQQDNNQQTQSNNNVDSPSKLSGGLTLEELNSKIIRCTRCGLARTRNNVVPGQGVEKPLVMVIGEGPGYDEDMQGFPFVGKAGMLLDKMLAAIQLDRKTNTYIANIVKCRPPENRDPFPDEQAACISFLEAQIHILKPKMILCMGRVSGHKLLNIETPMGEMHGKLYEYNNIPVMVTYHPSALLRNQDLKRPAWEDLKIFRKKLDELCQ